MVFHVYLNWTGNQYHGRELLVFADRQCADEFYNRAIETTKATNGDNLMTDVVRHNPQFWSFSTSPESRPFWFVQSYAQDLMPTYMAARIHGYDSNEAYRQMPIIQNDPTGSTEYRSGGSYYIRTVATPHLYWFYDGSVYLSSNKRSKFRIDRNVATDASATDPRHVLERKDSVRITALGANYSKDIGVSGDLVSVASSNRDFLFGSFYNGDFGVDYTVTASESPAFVTYKASFSGDQWELVN